MMRPALRTLVPIALVAWIAFITLWLYLTE
jgi:hypothetical protein